MTEFDQQQRAAYERFAPSGLDHRQVFGSLDAIHGNASQVALDWGLVSLPDYSLLTWSRMYLPQYFTRAPSQMHRWLEEQFALISADRGVKLNVIGPRGGAKSTLGTLAWPLRLAVERREPYLWIVSDTKQQAATHLDNLKAELIDNPQLRRDYPRATGKGPVWRDNSITLRNGVVIEAFGTGQAIRGRRRRENRPQLIICDDLQNDRHMQSSSQREHSRRWFHGTLLKAGTKRTNVLNLATALHREALALELNRTPGWISRVFRAIQTWPNDLLLWQQWETLYSNLADTERMQTARAFYDLHRADMDEGCELLWPDEEDLYTLMRMRAESGRAAFEREKQGSPVNPEMCEWPDEYFDQAVWFDEWPSNLRLKVMALDPSKGNESRHGDYSAFVVLGIHEQGTIYLEADLARRPTPQMVADGVELYRRFRPQAFGIESNQYQELLGTEFDQEFRRQGMFDAQTWTLLNHANKQVRIRRLGPYLAARRLRFKAGSPSTHLLVDQLKDFPLGNHDDGPDAVEMALRLASELLHGNLTVDNLGSRLNIG